uniref:Uncharacterized protein n=1 Tax=Leptocylindrus danicus TaxID=163516 RepID=A0A7S2LBY8_9STRA|mmetsp:Transcript_34182/g.49614  ORF Transcript_34182/g.49614 Transcript_34182/m.49614 type:complete len:820 (+) Transcript_34182:160-2619(+)
MMQSLDKEQEEQPSSVEYYVEEMAHQYYTNVNTPLPPAPPPPNPPKNHRHVSFSFDPQSRVIFAAFQSKARVTVEVEEYILKVMERTDLTLVMEGAMQDLDMRKWQLRNFADPLRFGNDYVKASIFRPSNLKLDKGDQHQARGALNDIEYIDTGETFLLTRKDYLEYLKKRAACIKKIESTGKRDEAAERFELTQQQQQHHQQHRSDISSVVGSLNCVDDVLCVKDMDLRYELTDCYHDFQRSFRFRDIFPGTRNCLTHHLPESARPVLGPTLSISPGVSEVSPPLRQCSFDTGTLMVDGEDRRFVLLRRLPNNHALAAIDIFNASAPKETKLGATNGEQRDEWPPPDVVKKWQEMNYYPSVFTLKKGQYLHINKGRLFCLNQISAKRQSKVNQIINWNWAFIGVSPLAINREVSNLLILNRNFDFPREKKLRRKTFPGAPIELAVLQAARVLQAFFDDDSGTFEKPDASLGLDKIGHDRTDEALPKLPSREDILHGLLPSLTHVVNQHCDISQGNDTFDSSGRSANTYENSGVSPIDPYGRDGFSCNLCQKELSNLYFHCIGCETLLMMDFNICKSCHLQQRYLVAFQQHPSNSIMHSGQNHTGHLAITRTTQRDASKPRFRCSNCKNSKRCEVCFYCPLCSCECHSKFDQMCRIMPIADELLLLNKIRIIVRATNLRSAISTSWATATTALLDEVCGTKTSSRKQSTSSIVEASSEDASVQKQNIESDVKIEGDNFDRNVEITEVANENSSISKGAVENTVSVDKKSPTKVESSETAACENEERKCKENQTERRSSERKRKTTSRYSSSECTDSYWI